MLHSMSYEIVPGLSPAESTSPLDAGMEPAQIGGRAQIEALRFT